MSWIKQNLVIIVLFSVGLLAGVTGYIYIGNVLEPHSKETEQELVQNETPEQAAVVNMEGNVAEFANWLELTRKRNVGIIIDNDISARPQDGLKEADLVYEIPIEGGTTRFMAFFSRKDAESVGPIRSARWTMIELAKEQDAILVHAGGSPMAFALFSTIDNLNALEGGVDRAFWRTDSKNAPNNLYSEIKTLRRVARSEGISSSGKYLDFEYLKEDENFTGSDCERISIYYGHQDFRAEYLYDKNTGKYLRFTGGLKHFSNNGEQLTAKNVIVQKVITKIMDKEGRLSLTLTGRGAAEFFSEGKVIQGFWEKKADGATQFFIAEGEPVALPKGNTWINIVPTTAKVVY